MKFYKAFSWVLLLTMFVQIISVLRTALLAKNFGISNAMDAFNLANTITVCIVNVVRVAVTTVLIPYLTKMKDTDEDRRILHTFNTAILGSTFVLMSVYFIGVGIYMNFQQTTSELSFQKLTLYLTFLLGIGQYVRLISNIQTAYLQVENKFIKVKIIGFLTSVFSFIYILATPNISIEAAAICFSLAYILESLYLVFANWGNKYRFAFPSEWRNIRFKELMKLTLPIISTSVLYQVTILLPLVLVRFFGEGYISSMAYANQIVAIMQTLILLNLVTMLYPTLSRAFQKNKETAKKRLVFFINGCNTIMIPLVFGTVMLGQLLVKILFERGNFTAETTQTVYLFLVFISASLPFVVIREFIFRAFYSLGDTKTPVKNSFIVIFIQIGFLIIASLFMGIYAVMLSPLVAAVSSVILGFNKLNKKIGRIDFNYQLLKRHLITIFNSLIMCVAIYIAKNNIKINPLLDFIIYLVLGIVVYASLTYLFQRKYLLTK